MFVLRSSQRSESRRPAHLTLASIPGRHRIVSTKPRAYQCIVRVQSEFQKSIRHDWIPILSLISCSKTSSWLIQESESAVMHCPPILNLFHIPIQYPTRWHNGQRSWLSIETSASTDTLLRLPPCLYFCGGASPVRHVALVFRPG